MSEEKSRLLSVWWLFLGLCFFANPFFAGLDLIPDCLGCILIYAALYRLVKISPGLEETRKKFLKLGGLLVIKDIAVLLIFFSSNVMESPTALLIAAFAMAVADLYFLIPAFSSLFENLTYLAMRENCTPLYAGGKRGKSQAERLRVFSVAFVLLREAFGVLPEFSALLTSSYVDSGKIDLYQYIGLMRSFCAIVVSLIGIVWLVFLTKYFLSLHKARDFRRSLGARYAAYAVSHPGAAVELRHGIAFLCLAIGAVLTADFYLDFKNLLPDVLAAVFLVAGTLVLDVPKRNKAITSGIFALYGGVGLWSTQLSYRFMSEFRVSDIARNEEVARFFRLMWTSSLLEFLIFFAGVVSLSFALRHTVSRYAGYRAGYHDATFETRRAEQLKNEFDGAFVRVSLFAFLAGLSSFLFDYIRDIPPFGFWRILEFFWFFDMMMSLLFAVILCVTLSQLMEQIRKKYQFDGIAPSPLRDNNDVPRKQKGDGVEMQNRNQNNQNQNNQNQNQNNQNQNNRNQNSQNNNQNQNNQNRCPSDRNQNNRSED